MPPTVAIVGAGFAGLAAAVSLRRRENLTQEIVLFERQDVQAGSIHGDIYLPNGRECLQRLGMEGTWKALTKESGQADHVSRKDLQSELRNALGGSIQYASCVTGIEEDRVTGKIFCILKEERVGPFDIVVGSDGVRSLFRGSNHRRVALIGDSRWAEDRFFDFGRKRTVCGADTALTDGIDFARVLSTFWLGDCEDLGRYCTRRKHGEILQKRLAVLGAISVALLLKCSSFPHWLLDHSTHIRRHVTSICLMLGFVYFSGKVPMGSPA